MPEQKAHYGPIVSANSPKTQPDYCPLLDTDFRTTLQADNTAFSSVEPVVATW